MWWCAGEDRDSSGIGCRRAPLEMSSSQRQHRSRELQWVDNGTEIALTEVLGGAKYPACRMRCCCSMYLVTCPRRRMIVSPAFVRNVYTWSLDIREHRTKTALLYLGGLSLDDLHAGNRRVVSHISQSLFTRTHDRTLRYRRQQNVAIMQDSGSVTADELVGTPEMWTLITILTYWRHNVHMHGHLGPFHPTSVEKVTLLQLERYEEFCFTQYALLDTMRSLHWAELLDIV